jgi:hypothetical protein
MHSIKEFNQGSVRDSFGIKGDLQCFSMVGRARAYLFIEDTYLKKKTGQ